MIRSMAVSILVGVGLVAVTGPAFGEGASAAVVTGKKFELDHGNPYLSFSVKVNKDVEKAWLKITARCKTGDEVQNATTGELLSNMKKGDSKSRSSVFSDITLKSPAAPCEFKFVVKPEPDVEEDAGTICWKSGKFAPGDCGF